MSDENIVCTYRLLVLFDQMEDGTVIPHVIPDPGIGHHPDLNIMFYMAEVGVPLAGLAAQAMYQLCDCGLVRHALEQARSIQRGVNVMLPNAPMPEDMELDFPDEAFAIH